LKRKFSLAILVLLSATFMPLAATSQVAPDRPARAPKAPDMYKWKAFVGAGYTSLNQVAQSENGLIGVSASVSRDFGKYFAVTADGGSYDFTYNKANPGNPKVYMALFGPEFHATLTSRASGFAHGLFGGVHTSGGSTPKISFAGGFGVGVDYKLNSRLKLRISGDDISSAFVQDPLHLGYSPHRRQNARAQMGVVYSF